MKRWVYKGAREALFVIDDASPAVFLDLRAFRLNEKSAPPSSLAPVAMSSCVRKETADDKNLQLTLLDEYT